MTPEMPPQPRRGERTKPSRTRFLFKKSKKSKKKQLTGNNFDGGYRSHSRSESPGTSTPAILFFPLRAERHDACPPLLAGAILNYGVKSREEAGRREEGGRAVDSVMSYGVYGVVVAWLALRFSCEEEE